MSSRARRQRARLRDRRNEGFLDQNVQSSGERGAAERRMPRKARRDHGRIRTRLTQGILDRREAARRLDVVFGSHLGQGALVAVDQPDHLHARMTAKDGAIPVTSPGSETHLHQAQSHSVQQRGRSGALLLPHGCR